MYEKLFWGNDLPPVTPAAWCYEPTWSEDELAQLSHLFATGIELTRAALAQAH